MPSLEVSTSSHRSAVRGPLRSPGPSAFTLIETLVALAALGIVLAIGYVTLRPSLEMRAASAVRSLLLQARAVAIWSGASVAVVEDAGGSAFVAREFGPATACTEGRALATLRLSDFPGVRLEDGLRAGGIYWLPSGSGRSCAGGGVISDTVLLHGPRGAAAVVVSSLGRVRLEPRP